WERLRLNLEGSARLCSGTQRGTCDNRLNIGRDTLELLVPNFVPTLIEPKLFKEFRISVLVRRPAPVTSCLFLRYCLQSFNCGADVPNLPLHDVHHQITMDSFFS